MAETLATPGFASAPADAPSEEGRPAIASWRSGWSALMLTLVARTALTMLASLLLVSLIPTFLGWHSTVVLSGSMTPALRVGDVVAARHVPAAKLRPGQVLLFDDPDHPGRLRMHRLVRIASGGKLVTKGDANRSPDSTPITARAVHGVGALRVPFIGLPRLLIGQHRWPELIALLAALVALTAGCRLFRAQGDRSDADP